MPTVITHSVVAVCAGSVFGSGKIPLKFWVLSIICSILPDADVIGYQFFYIPYDDFFGHRGFFHSPFFAAFVSILIVSLFFRNEKSFTIKWWKFVLYFFILTASHGLLDALTNGGRGIALLSPFSNNRYFFPWAPIEVSPLGIKAFISERGLIVLKSEIIWIWVPSIFIVLFSKVIRILMFKL
ncbi:MAG: metal-dependent hydrolase [Deltaproteobacteria bacterium]|nr:metal-dependent hydrolase [Deltaproteobacteria bacterium]MBW2562992.1 metal-dependent hydrolase [Deltaproteobacteria bacterium]